jgi:hypothetical protein
LCVIIRRRGFLCAIVGVISGWRNFSRWRVAVLNVDRTIASFRFILVDVGAVSVLTLITECTFVILVNSYTAIAQINVTAEALGPTALTATAVASDIAANLNFLFVIFLLLLSSSCSHDRKVVVKQQADPLSTVFCMGTRFSQKRFQPYDNTLYEKIRQK